MRFFYSLLMYLLWPIWLLVTIIQALRRQGGWRFLSERMGWSASAFSKRDGEAVIWFHAASVGELRSILPLILEITFEPKIQITVSTNTPEAMRELRQFIGSQQLESRVSGRYCAIDFYFATRRSIGRINADALWVVETELWPNLFAIADQQRMSVGILNGRLSDKTLNTNGLVKLFYQQILNGVDYIAARGSVDRERFIELGADASKIGEQGNLKRTAIKVDSGIKELFDILSDRDYVLALSTREDEELLLWKGWEQLDKPPLLVLAPRHIRRADELIKMFSEIGVKIAVRSRGDSILADTQIYLADTMREAERLAVAARWVFVGGSLVNKGGHNVLEPAMWGKYVACGPFTRNVDNDVEWLISLGCLKQIASVDQAGQAFTDLLNNQRGIEECCELARNQLHDNNRKLLEDYKELCLKGLR